MTEVQRWLTFGEHGADFEDEAVISCFVAKIYFLWRGRNAYWGTWSSKYWDSHAFFLQLETAKSQAELFRAQGSAFTIIEMPVLALCGSEDAVVVGEINTASPLAEIKGSIGMSTSVEALAQIFEPRRLNSIVRFICPSSDVAPAAFPFVTHRSRPAGSGFKFRWKIEAINVDLDPIVSKAAQICRHLQKNSSVQGPTS